MVFMNPKSPYYFSQKPSQINKQEHTMNKSKQKSHFDKAILTLIGLGIATHLAYDFTRPTVTGKIIGGDFSNDKISQVYLKNSKTESIDTLIINTYKNGKKLFEIGEPENYINKAQELKEKLKPGTITNFKIYKDNQIYKIQNIISSNQTYTSNK